MIHRARTAFYTLVTAWTCYVTASTALAKNPLSPDEPPGAVDVPLVTDGPLETDEPLVTDRPDFTESTDAVPTGRVQLELGYTFTYDREGSERVRSHSFPEFLTRVGLAENFELRVGWSGYTWADERFESATRAGRPVIRDDHIQGANDMSVGFKLKFCEQEGLRPHLGLIGEISLPSGSTGHTSADVDPGIKLLWAYDLSESLSLAGNLNLAVPTQDGHRFVQASASISLAASLNDWLGTYIEYFGHYPAADGEDAAHSLNGGFTFLINDDVQIDVLAGFGLNEQADDFFTGVGLSWRL